MKSFANIHRLKLTTITPVCIGGDQGNQLSPYSDYVVSTKGDQIHYVHQDKLEQAVATANLLDEYVANVQTGMDNTRSNFDLRHFIAGRLKLETESVTRFSVANHGIRHDRRIEIKPIVKSAGRAFLPGSSVKGALRTAMLYDWLVKSSQGEEIMRQHFENLRHWDELEREYKSLKNDRSFSATERKKDLNKKIKGIERELFNEDKLFGTLRDDAGQDSRRIRVSDTNFAATWAAYSLRRIRLLPMRGQAQQGNEIPIFMEALPAGLEFDLTLTIEPPIRHPALAWLETSDTAALLKNLNNFTLAALAFENAEVADANNRDFQDEIEQLRNFYENLENRATGGEVLLRLGFGKTIYDNSLALALYNGGEKEESEEAFNLLRSLVWKKNIYSDDIYPVTRTVTSEGEPLGWVKVEAE